MNGLLFVTIHVVDARLAERADNANAVAPVSKAERPARDREPWALPLWSRCRGSGPIAWRQGMNLVRDPGRVAFAAYLYAFLIFFIVMAIRVSPELIFLPTFDGHLEINWVGARICGVIAIMLPMLIASAISFDFRSDMGHIGVLKSLPIKPIALVAGQLFVPVAIAAIMQWLTMAAIAIVLRSVPPALCLAAAFVPAVSVILMAIENLLVLWFPMRQQPGAAPEPFELIGRVLLHPFVRMAAYSAVVVAALMISAVSYFLLGQSIFAALAAAWLALAAGGLALVVLLAETFDQFDVTRVASA